MKAKQSSSRERESQKQAPFPGIYSHLPHWDHLLQEATLIPLKSPSPEIHIPHLRTTSALQHSGKNHQTPWGTCFFRPPEGLPAPRLSPERPPTGTHFPCKRPSRHILVPTIWLPQMMVLQAETPTSNSRGRTGRAVAKRRWFRFLKEQMD